MRLFIIGTLIAFVAGKQYLRDLIGCNVQDDPLFPACRSKVKWMQANWRADYRYKENGVDGSICSIIYYLSRVERFCPCVVPNNALYPQCLNKVKWMQANWKSSLYYRNRGVDGSVCSIIEYLRRAEKVCP
ncbi:alpha-1,6-mannosylglycoprotein 6-beta-N-acetylglucosaminyltransferase B-like [Hydra vulgaris]|uniref:alpha-1,6-mannosyl-glycoprotein 6-beta-N-acetylglucosaminyltransferase n=1 Tax=Hydra vulgaris TaxID=6087 RepID=A0ABM4CQK7_HYDVU